MSAVAYGGRPPGGGIWERIQQFVREHDPRVGRYAVGYALFGLAIGWVLGTLTP